MSNGHINYKWPYSIAMLNYQRVNWGYLPYVRPLFQAFAREYPSKIWPYIVQYLHFRILEFPLIIAIHSPEMRLYRIFTLLHLLAFYWEMLLATGHRIKHLGIKKNIPCSGRASLIMTIIPERENKRSL